MDKGLFIRQVAQKATYVESMLSYTRIPIRPKTNVHLGENNRKINSVMKLRNKVLRTFYSVPTWLRDNKIPPWFPEHINIPKYLFRIKGKLLSPKQVILSTISRLYLIYRFRLGRGPNRTSLMIKISKHDNIYRLLRKAFSRNWYTMSHILYRRLKVLLYSYT
jgi:hypothetical protein